MSNTSNAGLSDVDLRVLWRLRTIMVLLAALLASCSDSPRQDAEQPPAVAPPEDSTYRIHVYIGEPGNRRRLDFGPVPEISGGDEQAENASVQSSLPTKPGMTVKGQFDTPDGSLGFDQTALGEASGWYLVAGAAAECNVAANDSTNYMLKNDPVLPPWSNNASGNPKFFIFTRDSTVSADSCDILLAEEQAMLCIAHNLVEIADAVGPLHWNGPKNLANTTLKGPWTIPPQSAQDRFIARDLALHVLAHIPRLDRFPVIHPAGLSFESCTEGYTSADLYYSSFWANSADKTRLFYPDNGNYYFPPNAAITTPDGVKKAAQSRLRFKATILRDAARMVEKLVRSSVQEDMGVGERRRAAAADPVKGNRALWGASGSGKYNSLSHAARILFGRWEMGEMPGATYGPGGGPDPKCGAVAASNILSQYGKDASTRLESSEVTTPGQKKAKELVQASGLILPKSAINGTSFRSLVEEQLIYREAIRQEIGTNQQDLDHFKTKGQGAAISAAVAAIPDADLRFALLDAHRQYRALASLEDDPSSLDVAPTNAIRGYTATNVSNAGGIVLDKGIPRGDLTSDAFSRTGGMQVASQCTIDELWYQSSPKYAFQDAFMLGQAYRSQLIEMREYSPENSDLKDIFAVAQAGAAEARIWSGAALQVFTQPNATGSAPTLIWINGLGFTPEDWGVGWGPVAEPYSEMIGKIVLVWGEPWVADCAAGLRTACPDRFDYLYVAHPTGSSAGHVGEWEGAHYYGADGSYTAFSYDNFPQNFTPTYTGAPPSSPPTQRLYAVLQQAPGSHRKGKVLAALALRGPNTMTAAAVSDLQHELGDKVLGVNKEWGVTGPRIGARGLSSPGGYCIEGVPWDQFVPLENELTSDSDQYENSWKHYIAMAKQAAQRADDLGQRLIDQGLQKDYRHEAAGEEIAEICGQYGAIDQAKLDPNTGTINPSSVSSDQTLSSCLEQPKKTLVFLTNNPFEGAPAAVQCAIKHVLGCYPESNTTCSGEPVIADARCKRSDLSSAGLNLVQKADLSGTQPKECEGAAKLVSSLKTGFDGATLGSFATQPWLSKEGLSTLAKLTNMAMYTESGSGNREWRLVSNGSTVMDSGNASSRWPGCLRTTKTADCLSTDEAPAIFDGMFRTSTGAISATELSLIRWRVEGALWTIAALAGGEVPEGMFEKDVPAVNFMTYPGQEDDTEAPILTIYGFGKFDTNGYLLSPDVEEDRLVLKATEAIPESPYPSSSPELPQWLTEVYNNYSHYRHVHSKNRAHTISDPLGQDNAAFIATQASLFNSLNCGSQFTGSGTGGLAFFDTVAQLKMGTNRTTTICKHPKSDTALLGMRSIPGSPTQVQVDTRNVVVHWGFADAISASTFCSNHGRPLDYQEHMVPLFVAGYPDESWQHADYGCIGTTQELAFGGSCSGVNSKLKGGCIADTAVNPYGPAERWGKYTRRVLLPRLCGPEGRILAAVNSYAPNGTCGEASQLAQAVGLACELSHGDMFPPPEQPPAIKTIEQLPSFQRWLAGQSHRASLILSQLYLEDIPVSVVNDILSENVDPSQINGEHGRILLQMGKSIRDIVNHWRQYQSDLRSLAIAFDSATNQLAAAKIQSETALGHIAIQRLQVHAQIAQTEAAMVAGFASPDIKTNISTLFASPLNLEAIDLGYQQLGKLDDLAVLAESAESNQMAQALINLEQTAQPLYTDAQAAMTGIQEAVADTLLQVSSLRQAEQKAKYEVAKGMGADYVEVGGQIVEFPVNSVLRREFEITKRRYVKALAEAKYLAFMARLAVEQRIGARLRTMVQNVGPLDPPAVWADDVCTLQGVNYETLRKAYDADAGTGPSEAEENAIIDEFADQYIGDYVAKLENFVEYYNIEYPSHDGDDTAVLSLREDLLGGGASCVRESPNLLYYSDRLTESGFVSEAGKSVRRGWQTNACEPGLNRCLRVQPAETLPAPSGSEPANANQPPDGQTGGGVTWLRETGEVLPGMDGGTSDSGGEAGSIPDASSEDKIQRSVVQTVHLETGSYMLSWWDQARTSTGALLHTGSAPDFRVSVLDDQLVSVASAVQSPYMVGAGTSASPWGERRSLPVDIAKPGRYHVVFSASPSSEAARGSVAVADVQLEQVSAPDAQPGAYVGTSSTRMYVSSKCQNRSPAELQAAFAYKCDSNKQCYYELATPIVIDTKTLGTDKSRLTGKLATGNFNYRHITVALNLVGTGVHDCEQTPGSSCYGSGFVEYTVNHDGYDAEIINHTGSTQSFNFGSAAINHGKALSAERYITLPISSSDQGLLSQSGIEKSEYRGRPLDGNYRIRIWDSPGLVWNKLEDIQFILKYRYWSAIQKQPGSH